MNRLSELSITAYSYYKRAWLKEHKEEVGSSYVCYKEFLDNEFQDEEIVKNYLSKEDFKIYKRINNLTLNIMVGIPGSGKSTYIKRHKKNEDLVICPDYIRKELAGDISNQSKNKEVWELAYKYLENSDENTWFDATNLKQSSLRNLIKAAYNFKKINLYIMADNYRKDLCKSRVFYDIKSGVERSNVPEDVIDRMYDNFVDLMDNNDKGINGFVETLNKEFPNQEINFRVI